MNQQTRNKQVISEHLPGKYAISVCMLLDVVQEWWSSFRIFFWWRKQKYILTGQSVFCLRFLKKCCVKAKARELIFSAVILFNPHVGQITIHHNAIISFFLKKKKALIKRQITIPFFANILFLVVSQAACTSCTNMGRCSLREAQILYWCFKLNKSLAFFSSFVFSYFIMMIEDFRLLWNLAE